MMKLCSSLTFAMACLMASNAGVTFAFTTPSIAANSVRTSTSTTIYNPQSESIATFAKKASMLYMASDSDESSPKKTGKIDTSTRSRLLSESIAPWRTLRIFLYISLGSGAFLGGFISATGLAAALSGAKPDVDLNAEYLNLAIDFGAAIAFALLTKYDIGKADELNQKVEEKIQQKKDNKVIRKAMKVREVALSSLNLEIRVSDDGTTQTATTTAVQTGGKQHMVIVVGPRTAIRDALLGANLLKMEFSVRDVLIVPYELSKDKKGPGQGQKKEDQAKLRPDGSGFGADARPTWETQPYVAQPVGEGWDEYIQAELNDAVKQNGEKVKEEGIAIVVANTGEIIRRGVGKVPWRNMVDELENKVKDDDMIDLGFLQG